MRHLLKKIFFFSLLIGFNFSSLSGITAINLRIIEDNPEKIIKQIELGLNKGNVDEFSHYFSERTYLSLANDVAGYYSANQTYYVLQDFLILYKPISFKLNNISTQSQYPYASGYLHYNLRGIRGIAQVFISLKKSEDNWRIVQITID